MNFQEAYELLKQGKKITSPSLLKPEEYVYLGEDLYSNKNSACLSTGALLSAKYTLETIMNSYWEEYKEPASNLEIARVEDKNTDHTYYEKFLKEEILPILKQAKEITKVSGFYQNVEKLILEINNGKK